MANALVDAAGHEGVVFANLQGRRPVCAKVFVRFPEDPITQQENRDSGKADRQGDEVICESKQRSKNINKRNQEAAKAHREKESSVTTRFPIRTDRYALVDFDVWSTNDEVTDPISHDVNDFGDERVHGYHDSDE